MTKRHWIAGGIFALTAGMGFAGCADLSRGPESGTLPPVSARTTPGETVGPSELIDLTDVDSIDRLIPSEPRVFYQYTDESGDVRFVQSLLEVPEAWRDRAGRVELAAVPPTSPAQARMLRKLALPEGRAR